MIKEVATAGFYESRGKRIPLLQMVTVADLLAGKMPKLPLLIDESAVFKKAAVAKKPNRQGKLL